MTQSVNTTAMPSDGKREIRFVVAAKGYSGLHHVADFSTFDRADLAIKVHNDKRALHVACAEIWYAPNGNIRMWSTRPLRVHVELVDPEEGFIGGDDITPAPATLNMQTGEIVLDNAFHGHPLLNWHDVGTCIVFDGARYHATIRSENLPQGIWGRDVLEFIQRNGYAATIDLESLQCAGAA